MRDKDRAALTVSGNSYLRIRKILDLFIQTCLGWRMRRAPVYAAAIAYSTLFSLAPLLILSANLAALTLNTATVETRLVDAIEQQVGPDVAQLTQEILSARTLLFLAIVLATQGLLMQILTWTLIAFGVALIGFGILARSKADAGDAQPA